MHLPSPDALSQGQVLGRCTRTVIQIESSRVRLPWGLPLHKGIFYHTD